MIQIAEEGLSDRVVESSKESIRFMRKEPLGTILVLAPWNYPYLTAVNVVVPALLAGNTVVLKHAQQTPLCSERLSEALNAAGLPEGVLQSLHLTHEQVAKLIRDSRIACHCARTSPPCAVMCIACSPIVALMD